MNKYNFYFVAISVINVVCLIALLVIDNPYLNLVGITLLDLVTLIAFAYILQKSDYNIPILNNLVNKLFHTDL